MRISDWSSDVCSSDLHPARTARQHAPALQFRDPVPQGTHRMKDELLDFDRAQALLAQAAKPLDRLQLVTLADAVGRVLAVDMSATLDLPPADNSALDGYAIRDRQSRRVGKECVSTCRYRGAPYP